jgi:ubiquinol-cytochrome c reductase iron-sulfur subunit
MRFKEDRVVTIEATSESESPTPTRRDFLYVATGAAAAVGMFASLFPMIDQMEPDASTLAAGEPVDFDLSKLQPGQQAVVRWRSRPIFIVNRPPAALKTLQDPQLLAQLSDVSSSAPQQPPYPDNWHRSIKREYSVLVGICTHLGCIPMFYPDPSDSLPTRNWLGGYFCPCHGLKIRSGRSRFQRGTGSVQSARAALSACQ